MAKRKTTSGNMTKGSRVSTRGSAASRGRDGGPERVPRRTARNLPPQRSHESRGPVDATAQTLLNLERVRPSANPADPGVRASEARSQACQKRSCALSPGSFCPKPQGRQADDVAAAAGQKRPASAQCSPPTAPPPRGTRSKTLACPEVSTSGSGGDGGGSAARVQGGWEESSGNHGGTAVRASSQRASSSGGRAGGGTAHGQSGTTRTLAGRETSASTQPSNAPASAAARERTRGGSSTERTNAKKGVGAKGWEAAYPSAGLVICPKIPGTFKSCKKGALALLTELAACGSRVPGGAGSETPIFKGYSDFAWSSWLQYVLVHVEAKLKNDKEYKFDATLWTKKGSYPTIYKYVESQKSQYSSWRNSQNKFTGSAAEPEPPQSELQKARDRLWKDHARCNFPDSVVESHGEPVKNSPLGTPASPRLREGGESGGAGAGAGKLARFNSSDVTAFAAGASNKAEKLADAFGSLMQEVVGAIKQMRGGAGGFAEGGAGAGSGDGVADKAEYVWMCMEFDKQHATAIHKDTVQELLKEMRPS